MELRVLRRSAISGTVALLLALFSFPVRADDQPSRLRFRACDGGESLPDGVIVLNLTNPLQAGSKDVAVLDRTDPRDARIITKLEDLLEGCPSPDAGRIRRFLGEAGLQSDPRARLLSRHATISVIAFQMGAPVEVEVTEVRRNRQVVSDFGELIDLIVATRKPGGAASGEIIVARADYLLREERATLLFNGVPYSQVPDPETGGLKLIEGSEVELAEVLTGDKEHFRLSANVPVNTVEQLSYDSGAGEPRTVDTPREFLAGFDWFYGDVLRDDYGYFDARRFGVKGLARFSSDPLGSVGVVAAYRFRGMSIVAGPIWTKQDVKAGTNEDGSDIVKEKYRHAWRVGLGFDLGTAASWLKSATTPTK